ncbi:hypothetical protein RDI58_011703 [Solanum bulbocastanum]|uniref:GH10 domain-containing protein n=1 Tax=Solanum bulbocastanum TaxID=147425 RepID=A0AAN8TXC3_SOLBU
MLEGSFSLSTIPDQVIFFLEGPPAGTDLLIKSVLISCPSSSSCDDADFGVNIITNTSLNYGTNGWFPLRNCTVSVQTGSPLMMPPMAKILLVLMSLYVAAISCISTKQASGPQSVNVALGVDSPWGPAAGVDLMVAGLQFFPVDRRARFRHLKRQTEKIRKQDVILKFSGLDSSNLLGTSVRIRQLQNSFPFGSAIRRPNMDNEGFNDFFVENFNWAVFGNELKQYWTEAQQGNFNYKDADELLNFCTQNNIQVRGLLTRYKGKFKHYDVINEMMHGSFYLDRLGKDISVNIDSRSSHEKYIEYIRHLQEHGAPVGGIGIHGHIDSPVGPIICIALDKLGILGLPILFTEVDVSSDNEYVRADDLEVILREAYAHPAAEGIMLWRFWELFLNRPNSHLVNAKVTSTKLGEGMLLLSTSGYSMLMVILMNKANSAFVDSMALMKWKLLLFRTKLPRNL